jgi:hypothetical protein
MRKAADVNCTEIVRHKTNNGGAVFIWLNLRLKISYGQ